MTPVLGTPYAWALAAIATAAWIVLACLGTAGYSAVAARFKRRKPDVVNWLPLLPPVPPSVTPPVPQPTQADIDATWLDAWPTEARSRINAAALQDAMDAMEQERYDRLFDDLIAIEGLQ